MNKSDLIAAAAASTGLTKKDVEHVINAALETITTSLISGEKVQLSGFGCFEVKGREARIARNPKTGEAMEVPPTHVPAFKPSKALKDIISGCDKNET